MAPESHLPQPGAIIADKYRVERVLGVGGMGTVFAVRHLGLDEPRALKLMLPRALELPQARERFFREARAAAKLRSDHAVKIHDVAISPEGFPYIEMEMLDGSDLAALLRRTGAMPIAHAVRWIAEACEPLGEAHALGIVHRDLKPGNLFLARKRGGGDEVKVLDFGIAKTLSQLESDPTLTSTNASFGSPLYMSPEQMRGARFAEPRSDLWALGVVLYELVTGRRPFQGESATALALVVTNDEPVPPHVLRPDLPPEVEAVILRCLEKRADARFANAAELAVALRATLPELAAARPPMVSTHAAIIGPPPSPFPVSARPPAPPAPSAPWAPALGSPPPSTGSFGAAPVQSGAVLAQGGAMLAQMPAQQGAMPPQQGVFPQQHGPMPSHHGVPSEPSVATLSTTVGRRGSNGNAVLLGGAIALVTLGTTMGVLLWRSAPPRAVAGAPAASALASAPSPVTPSPPPASRTVEVDTPPASPSATPSAAPAAIEPVEPGAPATSAALPAATSAPSSGAAASSGVARAPTAPASGAARPPPRPKPKTSFGGID